jgi:WD40 repeat protein
LVLVVLRRPLAVAAAICAVTGCKPGADSASARLLETLTTKYYAQDVAFSPDGAMITAGAQEWKLDRKSYTGSGRWTEFDDGHHNAAGVVAYSPDGKYVATGWTTETQALMVWNATTGAQVSHTWVGAPLRTAAFSPDGRTLATGSDDKRVWLWDTASGHPIASGTGAPSSISSLTFSADGKTLKAACFDGSSLSWDVHTPVQRDAADAITQYGSVEGHPWASAEPATSGETEFSPDGQLFGHVALDHFSIWSVASQARLESVGVIPVPPQGGDFRVLGAARFSPDGKTVALAVTAKGGQTTELWDVSSAKRFAVLPTGEATRLAFSPDGHSLAVAQAEYPESHVEIWDISQPLASLKR